MKKNSKRKNEKKKEEKKEGFRGLEYVLVQEKNQELY